MGLPLASIKAPSGAGLPSFFATRILPIATALVAMSSNSAGWRSVAGIAMQTGFVTNRASVPRNGATVARWSVTLTKCSETSPAELASSP